MSITDQARLAEVRQAFAHLDRLTRVPKRMSPSAPWIIPATMIVVATFALICLVIKLIMNYLNSKHQMTKTFDRSCVSSPDIPTTPEDQTSMATTASMKTRGSLVGSMRRHRNRHPPVSLYQVKHKQSPGTSATKSKTHRAAMKAISRAAKSEANRSLSKDDSRQRDNEESDHNNDDNNSPNLSDRSVDIDEAGGQTHQLAFGAATSRTHEDSVDAATGGNMSNQPEVHIVQIRDLEDTNLQHSQEASWPQAESDI